MSASVSSEPGYNVYLLYQKEVYNCDHSFLQSMMDWLYSSVDSPYKFRFRNKAFINISHFGILIQKDNLLATLVPQSPGANEAESSSSSSASASSNWSSINFNLKHLKEIYVDKRHKDTCVLVSKVSSSSPTLPNNYVWKAANPSNYQSFRSPYSLNNAYKKSYLLTIIKFKEGPGRLLQSIQLLDSILADFNKKDLSVRQKASSKHHQLNSADPHHGDSNKNEENSYEVKTSQANMQQQQYFGDYFSKQANIQYAQQMYNNSAGYV